MSVVSDVGELTGVVAAIGRRLAALDQDDPGLRDLIRDRDRATLYLLAMRSGRPELIPDVLYQALVGRYAAAEEPSADKAPIRSRSERQQWHSPPGGSEP